METNEASRRMPVRGVLVFKSLYAVRFGPVWCARHLKRGDGFSPPLLTTINKENLFLHFPGVAPACLLGEYSSFMFRDGEIFMTAAGTFATSPLGQARTAHGRTLDTRDLHGCTAGTLEQDSARDMSAPAASLQATCAWGPASSRAPRRVATSPTPQAFEPPLIPHPG